MNIVKKTYHSCIILRDVTRSIWNRDLKSCPFSRFTRITSCDPGNFEDFPNQEKPGHSSLSGRPCVNILFVIRSGMPLPSSSKNSITNSGFRVYQNLICVANFPVDEDTISVTPETYHINTVEPPTKLQTGGVDHYNIRRIPRPA